MAREKVKVIHEFRNTIGRFQFLEFNCFTEVDHFVIANINVKDQT